MLPPETASALGFTLEELALNRAGQLSEGQLHSALWSAIGCTVAALVLAAPSLCLLFVKPSPNVSRFLVGLSLVLGILLFWWKSVPFFRDFVDPQVASVEGPIDFRGGDVGGLGKRWIYFTIGGKSFAFSCPKELLHGDLLTQGAIYRGYYSPYSDTSFSLERLETPRPPPQGPDQ